MPLQSRALCLTILVGNTQFPVLSTTVLTADAAHHRVVASVLGKGRTQFGNKASTFELPACPQVFAEDNIFATATEPCDADENLDQWLNRSDNVTNFISVWTKHRPKSFIQIDDGAKGCLVKEDPHTAKQILSLIHHSPLDICLPEGNTTEDSFYQVPQHFFPVKGSMRDLEETRSYAAVHPAECMGVGARCPLVVSLQGVNEHAEHVRNWYEFQAIANTGLLHMVQWDPACLRQLRSILIFPQLLANESMVEDGLSIVENFVVPLVFSFLATYDIPFEDARVSIVGYSEGAFGVLQAAVHYPHIFESATMIAASIDRAGWHKVSRPTAPAVTDKPWRLKGVIVAFGEKDESADQSVNLEHVMRILRTANLLAVPTVVRLYAGLGHNHWENMFNKWPALHELIWRGNSDKLSTKSASAGCV